MMLLSVTSAPLKELDVTIFDPSSRDGVSILEGASRLVEEAHKARLFTDTNSFKLR